MKEIKPPKELTDEIEWSCPKCMHLNEQTIFAGMPDKLTCDKCGFWFAGLRLRS